MRWQHKVKYQHKDEMTNININIWQHKVKYKHKDEMAT